MVVKLPLMQRLPYRNLLFGALLVCLVGMTATAQPGRRGGGMSPDERAKIDEAQIKTVAADLKLDEEKTGQLVTTVTEFRKESAANRPEGGGRGDWAAIRAHYEAQKAKLTESLKGFLDEAQASQAADLLSGFSRGWGRYVHVILGFKLEEAKEKEALGYALAYAKAEQQSRGGEERDFEAMRNAMTAAKKTLDGQLAPLLSDEQKTEWTEKTTWERRGGEGRRGGRGDGDGRRGRDRDQDN